MSNERQRSSDDDLVALYKHFWDAYEQMRTGWRKQTGGEMELDLTIRDAAAQAKFQRRSAGAAKGHARRKRA